MPKKLTHHKKKPKAAQVSDFVYVQIDPKDVHLKCPGEACSEHKPGKKIHWYVSGFCSSHMGPKQHSQCRAVYANNMGGRKPVVCECVCHQGGTPNFGSPEATTKPKTRKGPKK